MFVIAHGAAGSIDCAGSFLSVFEPNPDGEFIGYYFATYIKNVIDADVAVLLSCEGGTLSKNGLSAGHMISAMTNDAPVVCFENVSVKYDAKTGAVKKAFGNKDIANIIKCLLFGKVVVQKYSDALRRR